MIIALQSMAFCGFFAQVLPGAIYQIVTGLGKLFLVASMLGASEDYGSRF